MSVTAKKTLADGATAAHNSPDEHLGG